jgi:hypothetical protein
LRWRSREIRSLVPVQIYEDGVVANLTVGVGNIQEEGYTPIPTSGTLVASQGLRVHGSIEIGTDSIEDTALSANIPKLDATNSFSGANTIDTLTVSTALTIPNQSVSDGALTTNIPKLDAANSFTGTNTIDTLTISTAVNLPNQSISNGALSTDAGESIYSYWQANGICQLSTKGTQYVTQTCTKNGAGQVNIENTYFSDTYCTNQVSQSTVQVESACSVQKAGAFLATATDAVEFDAYDELVGQMMSTDCVTTYENNTFSGIWTLYSDNAPEDYCFSAFLPNKTIAAADVFPQGGCAKLDQAAYNGAKSSKLLACASALNANNSVFSLFQGNNCSGDETYSVEPVNQYECVASDQQANAGVTRMLSKETGCFAMILGDDDDDNTKGGGDSAASSSVARVGAAASVLLLAAAAALV